MNIKVLCLLMSVASIDAADPLGDDSSTFDYDNYDYFALDADHSKWDISQHEDLVTKLFGSEDAARARFWDKLYASPSQDMSICEFQKIWILEDLKSTVLSEDSRLTGNDKQTLIDVIEVDLRKPINKMHGAVDCGDLREQLQSSRSNMDCAIGRRNTTKLLRTIFNASTTECYQFAPGAWMALVQSTDFPSRCNVTLVYSDMIHMSRLAATFYNERIAWDVPITRYREELGGGLLAAISSKRRLRYLTRSLCSGVKNLVDCDAIITPVTRTICDTGFSLDSVYGIENVVKMDSVKPNFDNLDDAEIPLEILEDVTELIHYASRNQLTIQPRNVEIAVSSLEIYMSIMDNTIGSSSKHIWSQVPDNQTLARLSRILKNNDKYVWSMSRLFFDSPGSDTAVTRLAKDSMTLQLHKSTENVDFQFDDGNIKTNFDVEGDGSELNVYAIHYESLAELIQDKGMAANSLTNETKQCVGKGGIISLSAHNQSSKVSIPVAYRMGFDRPDELQSYTRAVCLSCEYLDLDTGTWSKHGCVVESVDDGGVNCNCNHTTNFGALMSPVEFTYNMTRTQYQVKRITSFVGSGLSVLALAACLVIFNVVKPSLRNDRVKAHISLTFALLIVHMTQLASELVIGVDQACLISAVVTHYFLLAAFFWMLIEGIFLYLYVVQVFVHSSVEYLRLIYVLGWTIPGLIVIISVAIGIPTDSYLEMNPVHAPICGEGEQLYPPIPGANTKYKRCWLSTTSGMAYSFIVPALVIIVVNSVILGKVFQVLMRVSHRNRSKHRPYSSASSSGGHGTKSFTGKYQKGRNKTDSHAPSPKDKRAIDKESSYGATSPTNNGTGTKSQSTRDLLDDSPERSVSPQHYMHNPSYERQPSTLHDYDTSNKNFVREVRTALKGAMVLLPILGIPWICGLLASSSYVLTMLFIVLNSTQGMFIFIVYCLMNGEVRRALRRQVKVAKLRSTSGRSRVGSTSSLKSLNSRFSNWRTKSTGDK